MGQGACAMPFAPCEKLYTVLSMSERIKDWESYI